MFDSSLAPVPDHHCASTLALLLEHKVVSGVSVVIHGGQRPFGVLGVHTRERRDFSRDEVSFIQSVANILAVAIERQQQELQLRKTRDDLKTSEARYRAIVDTTQEWIWEIDLEGIHTFSNPAVERILGYSAEELVGQPGLAMMHEEDRGRVEKRLSELMVHGQGWSEWVLRWRHRDGGIRYLESNAVPIFNDQGRFCGYRGADRDVTARISAEEAVLESARSLTKAQQLARLGSWEYDFATGRPSASAETFRITGVPDREPLPTVESFISQFVHPGDREELAQLHRVARKTGKTGAVEFRLLRWPDGEIRHVRAEAEIVRGEDRLPSKIVGTLQDITEQKNAELALRESEEKFRLLTEKSPTIVLIAQAERIVYGNPTLTAVTGYSLDELRHMDLLEFVHPEHRELVADRHRRRLEGKQVPQRYEIKFVTKSGETRWLDLSTQLIDLDYSPAVLVTAVDITQRRIAGEQLRNTEMQLAHMSRVTAMGEMATVLAHELSQPLGAAANYTGGCIDLIEAGEIDLSSMSHALTRLNEQVLRCGEIIRRLKAFVSVTSPVTSRVSLNDLAREVEQLIHGEAVHHQAVVRLELEEGGPHVEVDRIQIQQVFVNLIRNALEAMDDLSKDERVVTVRIISSSRAASACVADRGKGFAADALEQMFEGSAITPRRSFRAIADR